MCRGWLLLALFAFIIIRLEVWTQELLALTLSSCEGIE